MKSNVFDVALIIEGGGMREAFAAGIVNVLIENGIFFDYVAGISAGSSSAVNYLLRDTERSKRNFVDIVTDPNFGGWGSFIKGNGFFNAEYIYENTSSRDAFLPMDFEIFKKNPAEYRAVAFDMISGEKKIFKKDDIESMTDLVKIVRASSSLPIFMPPTVYKGHVYLDGGLTGGIALDVALNEGYKKFFIIRTQEKEYRKKPVKYPSILKKKYKNYPEVYKAIMRRHKVYNATCDMIEKLEEVGAAYVVYPEKMNITNRETNIEVLEKVYEDGYNQGKREVDKWKKFVGM